ncbi:MAG TPA: orotidine-5'-phosphate decarboxylase [Ignavibacteria bacterium]
MHFLKKIKKVLRETNSHLIVGLDTDLKKIPVFLKSDINPIAKFNQIIVEATKDYVCGYKLNIAFYERVHPFGYEAILSTLARIPQNLITIADAKRGDIENSTELYAQTYLDELGFDSITVHPYMGQDSIRPFLRRKNKFVFLLALTSNYGANDFQFLKINKTPLWEHIVQKALNWNSEKIGFVVGANHPDELKLVTKKYPETPILIPGIGAQKGSLEKTINALQHTLFVINQSRSIIYCNPKAKDEQELVDAVKEAAKNANDEINRLLQQKKK